MALYDELYNIDRGIADAYQKATQITKANPKGEIDPDAVMAIFQQAIFGDKSESITPLEVKALLKLTKEGNFTTKGKEIWEQALVSDMTLKALTFGSGKLLKTDADLDDVNKALDLAALHVNFHSPGTNLDYNTSQYMVVRKLVEQGDIHVVELNAQGLLGPVAAAYHPAWNTVFLLENLADKIADIAHEMTHALQDWHDFVHVGARKYVEADAYIAQGLVMRGQLGQLKLTNPVAKAVEMVKARKANANNPDWFNPKWKPGDPKEKPGAYDEAAEYVITLPGEQGKPPDVDMKTGEATNESELFDSLLKQLKQGSSKAPAQTKPPPKPGASTDH